MFGRGMRYKPVEHIIEEIKTFHHYRYERVFLVDDNIAGNFRYLKRILREITKLNNSFKKPLGFVTQISINIAKDDELLELLAEANFVNLVIGVESPNVESLKDVNKVINLRTDMLSDLDKIQSYGMRVQSSMMVGFDHDSSEIFDEVFNFIMEASLPLVAINMVNAPPGTKLWHRLAKEGRIVTTYGLGNSHTTTNIIPKKMTRAELFEGYASLIKRLYKQENLEKRIEGFLKKVKRRPNVSPLKVIRGNPRILFLLISYFLFSRDKNKRRLIRKLVRPTPFLIQKIIAHVMLTFSYKDFGKWIEESLTDRIAQEFLCPPQVVPVDSYLDLVEKFDCTFTKNVLPKVYTKIFRKCGNIRKTNELAASVLLEFIQKWKDNFEKLESHHFSYLDQLCDNSIEGIKKGESAGLSEEEYSEENIEKWINKHNLNEVIYKVICEELRGEAILALMKQPFV